MTSVAPPADRLQVGSDMITVRVRSAEAGGALFAAEVHMAPGGGPPVMHRHVPGELYNVLAGEFALYIEDEYGVVRRSTASAGEVVPIPCGRSHTIRNESRADARAFVVYAPGEQMERFVYAAAALASNGSPSIEDVLELAAQHGVEMTGPIPER